MIPRTIHYCWFGGKEKPNYVLRYIESWRKYFPDFNIKEWNEKNFDVFENRYSAEAYNQKKWAFVSDYVRMKVLSEQGGIYFDTDVEILRKFPKTLLNLNAFTGFEAGSLLVSPGLVFACHPENTFVRAILDSYDTDTEFNNKVGQLTINQRMTELLCKDGLVCDDSMQVVNGLTIFPSEYFCGYDPKRRIVKETANTYATHHYQASWYPFHRRLKVRLGTMIRHILYYSGDNR
jgi:hypothetical protein